MEEKKWKIEETIQLIKAYQEYPQLWNPKHIDYKDRNKRNDSFKELAKKFNVQQEVVEKKIKTLLNQFQRERRNYKMKTKSGAGQLPFETKWFAYEAFKFLLDRDTPTNTTELGLPSISNEGVEVAELDTSADVDDPLEMNVDERAAAVTTSVPITPVTASIPLPKKRSSNETPKVSVKSKKIDNALENVRQIMQDVNERTKKNHERDDCSAFGELVTHKLRRIASYRLRTYVEKMISDIFLDVEMGSYDTIDGSRRQAVDDENGDSYEIVNLGEGEL